MTDEPQKIDPAKDYAYRCDPFRRVEVWRRDSERWPIGAGYNIFDAYGRFWTHVSPHHFDLVPLQTRAPAIDLTAITTPFGLLDEATQKALKECGGPWEFYSADGFWHDLDPAWCADIAYRQVPPKPKPSVDWSEVPATINAFAMDTGDREDWRAYSSGPDKTTLDFDDDVSEWLVTGMFPSLKSNGCDWKDSLLVRPGYEDGGT